MNNATQAGAPAQAQAQQQTQPTKQEGSGVRPNSPPQGQKKPTGAIAQVKAAEAKQTEKAAPKEPAEPQAWGDDDDRELWERWSRSPYGKLKADGKDFTIASKEDWESRGKRAIQKGIGADKLIEQNRAQLKEYEARLAKYGQLEQSLEAARQGDETARRNLGLFQENEVEALAKKLEALPNDEARELFVENLKMKWQRQSEIEAAEGQKRLALFKETTEKARTQANEIMKGIGYDKPAPALIAAMHEKMASMRDMGAVFGEHYDTQDLLDYANDKITNGSIETIAQLSPEKKAEFLPKLVTPADLTPAALVKTYGKKAALEIGRAFMGYMLEMSGRKPTVPNPTKVSFDGKPREAEPVEERPKPVYRRLF